MSEIKGYKVNEASGILLNANECYRDLPQKMKEEIAKKVLEMDFRRYPSEAATELKEAYAKYLGLKASNLIIGNGSDDILGLMISIYLSEGKTLFTFEKDFSMYDYYVSRNGGSIKKYDWKMDEPFNTDEFIKQAKGSTMVLFSNPNNPTGRIIKKDDLIKIIETLPETIIFMDEAYGEFADESVLDYLDIYPNLFITKTLSKAFGLAGIRLGFLIASEENIAKIAPMKVPFTVSTFTQLSACVLLNDLDYVKETIKTIKEERDALYEKIKTLPNITFYPSNSNFIYGTTANKKIIMEALEKKNIVIRDYKDEYFRISVGTKEENDLVYETLKEALS